MRKELRELVMQDWSKIEEDADGDAYGYGPHVDLVVAMQPTPAERKELANLFLEIEEDNLLYTLSGVMYEQPDPIYSAALIQALDSSNRVKKLVAMGALLRGGYEGAWELLFSRPDVQVAMRDEFPREIWGSAGDLPEAWQRRYLDLFCERFHDDPPLDIFTHQWLRTLAAIPVTDDATVETLLRTWGRLGRGDMHDKYLVLLAMAASPVPAYEPMLKKAAKSKLPEIEDAGKKGLAGLRKE